MTLSFLCPALLYLQPLTPLLQNAHNDHLSVVRPFWWVSRDKEVKGEVVHAYTLRAHRTHQISALDASPLTWHLAGLKLKKLT